MANRHNSIIYIGGALAMVHYVVADIDASRRGVHHDVEPTPLSALVTTDTGIDRVVMDTTTEEIYIIPRPERPLPGVFTDE